MVSLVLHGLIAIALFVVTWMLLERAFAGREKPGGPYLVVASGLATLLFCVHPLRTEVVVWLSAQPYLPSVLCMILGVGAYLKASDPDQPAHLKNMWLAASFALGGAAMLFKAVAVTYPLILLILDAYPLGRPSLEPDQRGSWLGWAPAVLEKLPLIVLSLALMIVCVVPRTIPSSTPENRSQRHSRHGWPMQLTEFGFIPARPWFRSV